MATGRAQPSWGVRRHQRDHPMTEQAKVITMARYIVRRRIMEELRASGVKLQEIEPEDISRAIQALAFPGACRLFHGPYL